LHKFAHLADLHLGANREPELREWEITAFLKAMNICIEESVDFIIISGDLFHANIPDMDVVNKAVKKIKQVLEHNIPIYVIYGSHDYSPNETSIIDILHSAGLITKVVQANIENAELKLQFITDPKTDVKITGLSGRRLGLEKDYFEILDKESLERERGFKIFAFHSAVAELKPAYLARMDSIPASYLPKGFSYYAGGHIHEKLEGELPDFKMINYPGPLFSGYPRDIEQFAKGKRRGFFIVHFNDEVEKVEFKEIRIVDPIYFEYDVSDKSSTQAREELLNRLQELSVKDKLVVLKIKGELSGGTTAEINSNELRNLLYEKGALYISINKHSLSSKEIETIQVIGDDLETIENNLFRENIGKIKIFASKLKNNSGVKIANELLKTLRQEQKLNEKKKDYEERILRESISILDIEGTF
jgi:exonuclease SbcD